MKLIDLTGQKFGRLTVVKRAENSPKGEARWQCVCDCGNEHTVCGSYLRNGKSRSCGCLNKEVAAGRRTSHGGTDTRLYSIWRNIKTRCENERAKGYGRYGGRGITVCPEWHDSFEAFRDWAMETGYRDDLTIDRIDNDGPYSPENCRWATVKEQANNTRRNRVITAYGEKRTLNAWSEITGIPKSTIQNRLRAGCTPEEALGEAQNEAVGGDN